MSGENNYKAISIDTNSLKEKGFALKGPILSKFQRFKESEVVFIQPDIIHRECLKHFSSHISETTMEAKKSLNKLNGHGILNADLHEKIKCIIEEDNDFNLAAHNRLKEFYDLSGAQIINVSDYLDLDQLFDMYFESKSPFEDAGKKKCEFPDACALLSLESWAEEQDINVVLISNDAGWERFAASSERMTVFKDVAKALDFLLPTDDKESIYEFILGREVFSSPEFLNNVNEEVESFVEGLDVYASADGPMNIYPEYGFIHYHDYDFKGELKNRDMFNIIGVDQMKVDISIPITINCWVEADFELFVRDTIDHEDISMGSIHREVEKFFDAEIFVSMWLHVSEGLRELSDLEITDIEAHDYDPNVGFGYIDLYHDDYNPYE